ncbi:GAL4-like Zn(II)2Cys6 (or C6 zinc) binuclear cluster DNA-binding domain [Rhizoctonia solani]|uniref:GAL4-like Zn(II)2Cys6 (Or C6 zinc) binuclear cluster DNA-binding domain n=1 Tax=Rhizoctonia solani TaxID=456999 RepID=A0A8H7IGC0_9AGAM|nr:GAL4-like Zn(II)2Cys6 (or C6 zinc) binuclear cluster DNA-binding domain [Rhizoctonia solani]
MRYLENVSAVLHSRSTSLIVRLAEPEPPPQLTPTRDISGPNSLLVRRIPGGSGRYVTSYSSEASPVRVVIRPFTLPNYSLLRSYQQLGLLSPQSAPALWSLADHRHIDKIARGVHGTSSSALHSNSASDASTKSPRVRPRQSRSRSRQEQVPDLDSNSATRSPRAQRQAHIAQDAAVSGSTASGWSATAPESTPPTPAYTAPRKQNVACDACRNRKVKCVKNPVWRRPQGLGNIHPQSPGTGASGRNTVAGFLSYIFAPPREDLAFTERSTGSNDEWGVLGTKLESEVFRTEYATLGCLYWILTTSVRTRFKYSLPQAPLPPPLPARDVEPLPTALIAVVLAWGAKFSEHPIIVHDRGASKDKSSILARALARRAREVAEAERIFRIATPDNAIVCLLLEPLQSQLNTDPDGFHGFWLNSGVRHMLELKINYKLGTMALDDSRGASMVLVMAWWMACLADGFSSAYFRTKPTLDDDDYNIQSLTASTFSTSTETLCIGTPTEFVTWYTAMHVLAREVRWMSRMLWTPVIAEEGIPAKITQDLMTRLNRWRDVYLNTVGVPSNFEADWNFVAAVSACSSDATFHVMYIILHQAVEDFGIRDLQRGSDLSGINADVESLQATLASEALHSALRIAALTGVLTTNGYLRLDPNVLHYSTYAAGLLLARQGRPEAVNCITGLRQYAFAYEEAHIQADEIEATLKAVNRERTQREQDDPHVASPWTYSTGRVSQAFAMGLPAVSAVHHPGQGSVMSYGGNEVPNEYAMYGTFGGMPAEQSTPHDSSHYSAYGSRR